MRSISMKNTSNQGFQGEKKKKIKTLRHLRHLFFLTLTLLIFIFTPFITPKFQRNIFNNIRMNQNPLLFASKPVARLQSI